MLVIYGTNSVKMAPKKSRNIKWNAYLGRGRHSADKSILLANRYGYTTTHSDYFCQSRNSRCEMLQSLRVWEVSMNRNNHKKKTDYWSKIRPLSLTESNATKNLRKQRVQKFIFLTSECIKIEIRSKKCAPNQFCWFWCCRNGIRLWFLLRIWKLKQAHICHYMKILS